MILVSFFVLFFPSQQVFAADQVVTNNNDSGAGSLRQAIADIQSSGSNGDTITFNLSAGNETIVLSSQIAVMWEKGLVIDGDNTAGSGTNVTIQVTTPGTSAYRVFEIRPYSATFTFKNMTIRGGTVGNGMGGAMKVYSGDSAGNLVLENVTITNGIADYGGCVYAWGTMGSVTVTNSTFQNCQGTSSSYGGGAMFFRSLSGNITISGSTFDSNTAVGQGGAIHIFDETFSITNSTFSNNTATRSGGAIYLDGDNALATATITNSTFNNNTGDGSPSNDFGGAAYFYYGKVAITNSTIFQNSSQIGGGIAFSYGTLYMTNVTLAENTTTGIGGGLYQGSSSTLYIKNTILANNGSNDYYTDGATVGDNGYNIVEVSSGRTWNGTGDITGDQVNLNLSSSLGTNSTTTGTKTLSLSAGSVAIDAGASGTNNVISVPTTDQRGLSRSGTYDIGAFEYGGSTNNVPILGYSSDNTLGTPTQATDGSGLVTIPFRVQDGDGESITTNGWQYSDDGGSSWNNLSASDMTSEDGSKATATDWTGTVYNIVWSSKNQLDGTSQNDIKFRFKVNDGTDDSAYGTTANFTVDNAGPTVSTLSPADNATGISPTANLVITFNEAVDVESGNITILKSSDYSLVEKIDVTGAKVTGTGTTTITINPATTLSDLTEYYILIDATVFDDGLTNSYAGISSTTVWSFTTADGTAPVLSSISSSTTDTSATVTWTTNEQASTQIEYGLLTTYGTTSAEADTSPRVTSHSVILNSLESCRLYYYRVKSTDASSNQAVSSAQTFSTTGCPINTIVTGSASAITTISGGEFQLSNNSSVAKLTVPDAFASENAEFQINRLTTAVTPPTGKSLVDENIFDLSALTSSGDLTTFLKDLTFTVTYGSNTETNFYESTLDVYRYNEGTSSWDKKNCTLDAAANTLTCSLSTFSTYAVFGDGRTIETRYTSSSSGSSSSTTNATTCSDQAPEYAPDLFQINVTDTTALIYFSPVLHTNDYFISFARDTHAEEYGTMAALSSDGVQDYTIQYLNPNTTYYVKVRGQRGCMPGEWSQIVKFKTLKKNTVAYQTPVKPPAPTRQPSDTKKEAPLPTPTTLPHEQVQGATTPPPPTDKKKKSCFLWWCW